MLGTLWIRSNMIVFIFLFAIFDSLQARFWEKLLIWICFMPNYSHRTSLLATTKHLLYSIIIPIAVKKMIYILYPFSESHHNLISVLRILDSAFAQRNEFLNFFLDVRNKFDFHLILKVKDASFVRLALLFWTHLIYSRKINYK